MTETLRRRVRAGPGARMARLFHALGVAGIVTAALFAVLGWILVDGIVDTTQSSLDVTNQALDAVAATIDVAEEAIATGSEGLDAVGDAVSGVEQGLATTAAVLDRADVTVGETVPAGLDAVRRPLTGLVSSTQLLEDLLSGLSIFGADFRPDPPPAQSLREIEEQLATLAEQLRDPAARLGAVSAELAAVSSDLAVVGDELTALTTSVSRAAAVLASYAAATDRAVDLVGDTTADLATKELLAKLVVLLVGAFIAAAASVSLVVGRQLRTLSIGATRKPAPAVDERV